MTQNILPLLVRTDLGVMAMKAEHSFAGGVLPPLHRCSQHFLLFQPISQKWNFVCIVSRQIIL